MNRRTSVTARRALAIWLVMAGLSGCATGSGNASCVPTELVAEDIAVPTETDSFALTARLTANGEPIKGAELEFFQVYQDSEDEETAKGGGAGTTDADGRATYEFPGGPRTMLGASDDVLLGYIAEYRAPRPVAGTDYCEATSKRARLDVPCAGLECLLEE
jgi:hypothetical protein